MTKLSWLLWLSDGTDKVQALCEIISLLGGMAAVPTSVAIVLCKGGMDDALHQRLTYWVRHLWAIIGVAVTLLVFIPNKTTILAIAATESAAMALQTPDGREITNEALNAVKAWLRAQIDGKQK